MLDHYARVARAGRQPFAARAVEHVLRGRLRHIFRLGEPVDAPADPGKAVKQRSLDIEPGDLLEALRRLVGGERLPDR